MEEKVKYWIDLSDDDLETAEAIMNYFLRNKRILSTKLNP
jgi:hypothetical protein